MFDKLIQLKAINVYSKGTINSIQVILRTLIHGKFNFVAGSFSPRYPTATSSGFFPGNVSFFKKNHTFL